MLHSFPVPSVVARLLVVAALFIVATDADAKGKRGGSSSSSSSKAQGKADADEKGSSGPSLNIRNNSSSSSSSSSSSTAPMLGNGLAPMQPLAAPTSAGDQEEAAKRAARLEALEREQAERAAAAKAAAEAERQALEKAAEKAAADRSAARAAEERAEAARVAAAAEKKRRDDAVVASDVDRVMQRALADYPLLKTPEGAPMLQKILARQQVLVGRGMYPSIALVEAVADNAHSLAPRQKQETQPVVTAGPDAAAAPSGFGTCRWATPTVWTCK